MHFLVVLIACNYEGSYFVTPRSNQREMIGNELWAERHSTLEKQ